MKSLTKTKIKKRLIKKSILVIAEGFRDTNFMKYLDSLYTRSNKLNVIIRNGLGGSATSIVQQAINTPGDYDKRVVVIDTDKSTKEMQSAYDLANENEILLIKNIPCIEATLINSYSGNQYELPKNTGSCKKVYEKKILKSNKIESYSELRKIFPKNCLNEKRKTVLVLEEMISVMEGKVL